MRILTSLIVVILTLMCGCVKNDQILFKAGSGDAGQFIMQHALTYGGQPITTSGLPAITGEWRYSEDEYGVIIRMPRDNYQTVENLLRLAFGQPTYGPSVTTDGGMLGGYRLTPQGGVIQFGYDADGTQVIVLQQLTAQEVTDGIIRTMKEHGNSDSQ